ncbi:MAG: hypothetical protein LBU61_04550, partial [Coriobacteriales bacterium]|nr:hypothetical protein [Coriobacteriales bacterium]
MNKLTKSIASFLTVVMLFSAAAPIANATTTDQAADVMQIETNSLAFEEMFVPASLDWKTQVANAEPAQFENVTVVLADDVIEIDSSKSPAAEAVIDNIATFAMRSTGSTEQKVSPNKIIAQGGYIDKDVLDKVVPSGRDIKPGTVIADMATGTAFRVETPADTLSADQDILSLMAPLQGNYAVATPSLHEIVDEFDLPEQTVTMTSGNINYFNEGIDPNKHVALNGNNPGFIPASFNGDTLNQAEFKYIRDRFIQFEFPDIELSAWAFGSDNPIQVLVRGGIAFGDLALD